MQIVINVSNEIYEIAKKGQWKWPVHDIYNAIKNGTPLPKGHGRLIDADELDVTTVETDDYSGNEVLDVVLKDDIDNAPTIIEADKAESEE